MSRVLSLSLADNLYDRVSKIAGPQGLTVYQYVRKAIERAVSEDERIADESHQKEDV